MLLSATTWGAATPSPALVVLNKEEATLAIVDPAAGKVVARVPVGESPHEVAVSADGRMAFVANYGSRTPGHTISVIDLEAQKELRRVDLGPLRKPHGIFVAGGKVYFTAEASKLIGRYDPGAGRIDWLMGTGLSGTHMVMVMPGLDRIFTANIGSDAIAILERGADETAWNQTVVAVGKGPEGFDVTPDGKELWAAHSRDGGVSIIDIAARRVSDTIDVHTRRSNRLKFTPDGRMALISDLAGNEVVVLDRNTRKEIKRLQLGRSPEGILMVPGAARAYVATAADNQVVILDLKRLEPAGRIATGSGPDGMAWAERR